MSNIKQTHQLKQLESRKAKLEVELQEEKSVISAMQKACNEKRQKIKTLNAQIKAISEKEPVLTEHAILRYLERKYSINLDEIRQEILTEDTKSLINTLQSAKIPIGDGLRAVVKNKTIITIEPSK